MREIGLLMRPASFSGQLSRVYTPLVHGTSRRGYVNPGGPDPADRRLFVGKLIFSATKHPGWSASICFWIQGRTAGARRDDARRPHPHVAVGNPSQLLSAYSSNTGARTASSCRQASEIRWFSTSPTPWWRGGDVSFSIAAGPRLPGNVVEMSRRECPRLVNAELVLGFPYSIPHTRRVSLLCLPPARPSPPPSMRERVGLTGWGEADPVNQILRLTGWASAAYQFRYALVEGYRALTRCSSVRSASYSLDTDARRGASGEQGANEGCHFSARPEPRAIK